MNSDAFRNFLVYFLLCIALILILVGDFMVLLTNNSFVGGMLILLGILIAIFAIFGLVG